MGVGAYLIAGLVGFALVGRVLLTGPGASDRIIAALSIALPAFMIIGVLLHVQRKGGKVFRCPRCGAPAGPEEMPNLSSLMLPKVKAPVPAFKCRTCSHEWDLGISG